MIISFASRLISRPFQGLQACWPCPPAELRATQVRHRRRQASSLQDMHDHERQEGGKRTHWLVACLFQNSYIIAPSFSFRKGNLEQRGNALVFV